MRSSKELRAGSDVANCLLIFLPLDFGAEGALGGHRSMQHNSFLFSSLFLSLLLLPFFPFLFSPFLLPTPSFKLCRAKHKNSSFFLLIRSNCVGPARQPALNQSGLAWTQPGGSRGPRPALGVPHLPGVPGWE